MDTIPQIASGGLGLRKDEGIAKGEIKELYPSPYLFLGGARKGFLGALDADALSPR